MAREALLAHSLLTGAAFCTVDSLKSHRRRGMAAEGGEEAEWQPAWKARGGRRRRQGSRRGAGAAGQTATSNLHHVTSERGAEETATDLKLRVRGCSGAEYSERVAEIACDSCISGDFTAIMVGVGMPATRRSSRDQLAFFLAVRNLVQRHDEGNTCVDTLVVEPQLQAADLALLHTLKCRTLQPALGRPTSLDDFAYLTDALAAGPVLLYLPFVPMSVLAPLFGWLITQGAAQDLRRLLVVSNDLTGRGQHAAHDDALMDGMPPAAQAFCRGLAGVSQGSGGTLDMPAPHPSCALTQWAIRLPDRDWEPGVSVKSPEWRMPGQEAASALRDLRVWTLQCPVSGEGAAQGGPSAKSHT